MSRVTLRKAKAAHLIAHLRLEKFHADAEYKNALSRSESTAYMYLLEQYGLAQRALDKAKRK